MKTAHFCARLTTSGVPASSVGFDSYGMDNSPRVCLTISSSDVPFCLTRDIKSLRCLDVGGGLLIMALNFAVDVVTSKSLGWRRCGSRNVLGITPRCELHVASRACGNDSKDVSRIRSPWSLPFSKVLEHGSRSGRPPRQFAVGLSLPATNWAGEVK